MKQKITVLLIAVFSASLLTGCLSTRTTETWTPVKTADGLWLTNYTRTISSKNQDPLKDKIIRGTEKSVGLKLQVLPGPAGTSSSLSPLDLLFGMQKVTYVSIPIYHDAGMGTNGYTPPLSYAASGAGSLWNDSDVENLSTAAGLLPGTNAYYAAPITSVNLIQPTTGTVAAPTANSTTIIYTNAPAAAVTSTNAP